MILPSAALMPHTGGVIELPSETWVSIGTLLTVAVALYGALKADGNRLEKKVDALDEKVEKKIDALGARLDERTDRLDDRVFALAVGLKPYLEAAHTTDPAARPPHAVR